MGTPASGEIEALISSTSNLKVLSGALHFLQKIGKDVVFEFQDETVSMQSLNDAKSSFAAVELMKFGFFDKLTIKSTENLFVCKLAIKPICAILTPKNLKIVKTLRIYNNLRDDVENEIVFEIVCNRGIRRTHRFQYQDSEVVSAVFEESTQLNSLCSPPKIFSKLLEHMQAAEIVIEASKGVFRVTSFHHPNITGISALPSNYSTNSKIKKSSHQSCMTSAITLETREFDSYVFHSKRPHSDKAPASTAEELVFCTKEVQSTPSGEDEEAEAEQRDDEYDEQGDDRSYSDRAVGGGGRGDIDASAQWRRSPDTYRSEAELQDDHATSASEHEMGMFPSRIGSATREVEGRKGGEERNNSQISKSPKIRLFDDDVDFVDELAAAEEEQEWSGREAAGADSESLQPRSQSLVQNTASVTRVNQKNSSARALSAVSQEEDIPQRSVRRRLVGGSSGIRSIILSDEEEENEDSEDP